MNRGKRFAALVQRYVRMGYSLPDARYKARYEAGYGL